MHTAKLGASLNLSKSKMASVLMFILPVVLFYIDVKIGHHRGELYLLFRWTKGLS
jgi:hypothetical protein